MQGLQEGFWFTAFHTLISPKILPIRVGEKRSPPPSPSLQHTGSVYQPIKIKKTDPSLNYTLPDPLYSYGSAIAIRCEVVELLYIACT